MALAHMNHIVDMACDIDMSYHCPGHNTHISTTHISNDPHGPRFYITCNGNAINKDTTKHIALMEDNEHRWKMAARPQQGLLARVEDDIDTTYSHMGWRGPAARHQRAQGSCLLQSLCLNQTFAYRHMHNVYGTTPPADPTPSLINEYTSARQNIAIYEACHLCAQPEIQEHQLHMEEFLDKLRDPSREQHPSPNLTNIHTKRADITHMLTCTNTTITDIRNKSNDIIETCLTTLLERADAVQSRRAQPHATMWQSLLSRLQLEELKTYIIMNPTPYQSHRGKSYK